MIQLSITVPVVRILKICEPAFNFVKCLRYCREQREVERETREREERETRNAERYSTFCDLLWVPVGIEGRDNEGDEGREIVRQRETNRETEVFKNLDDFVILVERLCCVFHFILL